MRGTRDHIPKSMQIRPPKDNKIMGKREVFCCYCHEPGHIESRCPPKEEEVNVMKKDQDVKAYRLTFENTFLAKDH